MIKIIIVDDHPVVREGIKQIMAKTYDIVVEDEASSGKELKKKLREKTYDVILLDISLPGRNGIEVLKEIKEGDSIVLKNDETGVLATLDIEEIYEYNKQKIANAVYGTNDLNHPGVANVPRIRIKFSNPSRHPTSPPVPSRCRGFPDLVLSDPPRTGSLEPSPPQCKDPFSGDSEGPLPRTPPS